MKKRRNQLILNLLNKKQILIMMKMQLNLDNQMKKEEDEENIALANFIESLQKQTDEKNFLKKYLDDCSIVHNEKKN